MNDVQLPSPGPRYDQVALTRAFDVIRATFRQRVNPNTAAPCVHLSAPNGSVWKVSVANDGTLTTLMVKGPPP